jgi:hypothetical protein
MPDYHPKTKTFHLTAIYIKMLFRIFYANVRIRKKKHSKKAPVELWRAKVPLTTIRS